MRRFASSTAFSAAASPSNTAACTSMSRPFASPTAKIVGTELRNVSSTGMAERTTSTPARSSPSDSTSAGQPVDITTASNSPLASPASSQSPPSVFVIDATPAIPVCTAIPWSTERCGHRRRDRRVGWRQDARGDVEQRDLRPERAQDRRQLRARVAAADDGDPARQARQVEHVLGHGRQLGAGDGQQPRMAADRDDHRRRGHRRAALGHEGRGIARRMPCRRSPAMTPASASRSSSRFAARTRSTVARTRARSPPSRWIRLP